MPQRCELTILSGNPLKDLDFGSIFNDCLSAFHLTDRILKSA
jgi:hypothetical protein